MDQDEDFAGLWEIPARRRLGREYDSVTHDVQVGGVDVELTVGLFPEGLPGELFVTVNDAESTARGCINAWARSFSQLLQYGVPLDDAIRSHRFASFPPQGPTSNPEIPFARSIVDYVARWLDLRFVDHGE